MVDGAIIVVSLWRESRNLMNTTQMQFVQSFSCHVFAWEFELILWDAQKSVVLLLGRPTEAREREQNHKHDSMPLQMILVPPTVVVNCLQSY